MRRRAFEIWERLYYLRSLRAEYLRIQYRYHLRKTNRWASLKASWKYALAAVIACLIVLGILLGYKYPWTGFSESNSPSGEFERGKTLWDWMDLLLIPALLALFAYIFTGAQRERELSIALLNKREQALQDYFDYMTHLFVEQDFSDEEHLEQAARIARARTMAVLEMLDPKQKGHLLRFLIEAELIHRDGPLFSMRRSDLRSIDLDPGSYNHSDLRGSNLDGASMPWCNFNSAYMTGVTMQNADLESTDFSSANLDYALLDGSDLYHASLRSAHLIKASLQDANLQRADLSEAVLRTAKMKGANLRAANLGKAYLRFADLAFADLKDADLTDADLSQANLYGANLRNANLAGADLTGANPTPRQMRKAKSLEGAKLPADVKT